MGSALRQRKVRPTRPPVWMVAARGFPLPSPKRVGYNRDHLGSCARRRIVDGLWTWTLLQHTSATIPVQNFVMNSVEETSLGTASCPWRWISSLKKLNSNEDFTFAFADVSFARSAGVQTICIWERARFQSKKWFTTSFGGNARWLSSHRKPQLPLQQRIAHLRKTAPSSCSASAADVIRRRLARASPTAQKAVRLPASYTPRCISVRRPTCI